MASEDLVKKCLWEELQKAISIFREGLTDAQVYRLLTDFAESHKPL